MIKPRRSVIPDAAVLIESWERAAAGTEDDLRPSRGVLAGLSIGVPLDLLLLLWVLA